MNFKIKSKDEIKDFCQKELVPLVQVFQEKYPLNVPSFKSDFIRFIEFFILGIVLIKINERLAEGHKLKIFLTLAALGALFYSGIILFTKFSAYFRQYMARIKALEVLKQSLRSKLFYFLDKSFTYKRISEFPKKLYEESGLFPQGYDSAHAEDFCSGTIDEINFELREIRTANIETYKENGKTKKRSIPIFRGIFFCAEFNKNFAGHTIIKTDQFESFFGNFARDAQKLFNIGSSLKVVELENGEFEKNFKVTSTDPVEARFILSPTFMEKILELKALKNCELQFSFINSHVLIALPHKNDFFDGNFNLEKLHESIEVLVNELNSLLEIIDVLDLDAKLWKTNYIKKGVS